MSLIQQALEKTSRAQETRTATPPPVPKPWERDPAGAGLEQELTLVQQAYARRRSLYWKVALGVLLICFVAGLSYVGIRNSRPKTKAPSVTSMSMPQAPLKIFSGNIYRLTGITDLGDDTIAVINGRLVGVGDILDGRTVVKKIGNGEVLLDVQGKEIRLTL